MDPTATIFLAWGLTVLVSLRFEWEGSRLQYLAVLVGAVTVVASWWLLGDDALGPQTGWAVAVSWLGVVAVVGILALHVHLAPWLDDISDHYAKDVGVVQLRPTRHAVVGGRVGLGLLVALLVVVGFVSQQRWLGWVCGVLVLGLLVIAGRFYSSGAVGSRQEGGSVRVRGLWGWRYFPTSALQGAGVTTLRWRLLRPGVSVVFLRVGGAPFAPDGGHTDVLCWGLTGAGPGSEELTSALADLCGTLGIPDLR